MAGANNEFKELYVYADNCTRKQSPCSYHWDSYVNNRHYINGHGVNHIFKNTENDYYGSEPARLDRVIVQIDRIKFIAPPDRYYEPEKSAINYTDEQIRDFVKAHEKHIAGTRKLENCRIYEPQIGFKVLIAKEDCASISKSLRARNGIYLTYIEGIMMVQGRYVVALHGIENPFNYDYIISKFGEYTRRYWGVGL